MASIVKKINNFIRNRGSHSGLNQTNNSFKMAATIIAPFLIVWFLLTVFAPEEWKSLGTTFSFIGWIVYIFALYSKAKADVASYLPFPQAHVCFPDGQQLSYDLLVPPNGWEEIASYKDGSFLYRVAFREKLQYQEADRPYPDIFNRMLWKTPADWNHSFKRNGHGEFFFENLFVDHPACENIELSVIRWEERGSNRLPIAVVTGCSYFYMEAMKSGGKSFPDNKRNLSHQEKDNAFIKDLLETNRELTTRNRFLEDEAEQYTKKEPRDIKELSDNRLERIRNEIGDIMDTELSWKDRILNAKFIGYALIGIAVTLLFTHFVFGFP